MPVYLTWPIGEQVREQTQSCLASESWCPSIHYPSNCAQNPVHHQTIRVHTKYILACTVFTQYILIYTCITWNITVAPTRTPQHGSTVEHGDQGRVTNPSLAGDVQITASQCNRLYSILVILHRRRARMLIDFLEEGLICLEVSSQSMETQDAYEHILVVGEVCHCLYILDMGVLKKRMCSVRTKYVPSMNWFVPRRNKNKWVCT